MDKLVHDDLYKFHDAGYHFPKGIDTPQQRSKLIGIYVEKLQELGITKQNYHKHSLKAWDKVGWFPRVSDFTDGPVSRFTPEVL